MLPLNLVIKPSLYMAVLAWTATAALGAILSLSAVTSDITWQAGAIVFVISLYSTLCWVRRYALLQHSHAITSIIITPTRWLIGLGNGEHREVMLTNGCRFWPYLIVLRMRDTDDQQWLCVLMRKSLSSNELRRLRVIGRWRPAYTMTKLVTQT